VKRWNWKELLFCVALLMLGVFIVYVKSEYDGTEDQIIATLKAAAKAGALFIFLRI